MDTSNFGNNNTKLLNESVTENNLIREQSLHHTKLYQKIGIKVSKSSIINNLMMLFAFNINISKSNS